MILNIDNNAKTVKGQKYGYLTGVLYLAPHTLSDHQVCPSASAGCIAACLNTAGRGGMNATQVARVRKTRRLFDDRDSFMRELFSDITKLVRRAEKRGLIPLVRLNGTSDLPWEKLKLGGKSLMDHFPQVQFYDYTKIAKRALKWAAGNMPANYSLTFSLTESNDADALRVLDAGGSVAVVFRDELPGTFWGFEVVNGDRHDVRTQDIGVVVGLTAKGRAKHDISGFVRDFESLPIAA